MNVCQCVSLCVSVATEMDIRDSQALTIPSDEKILMAQRENGIY